MQRQKFARALRTPARPIRFAPIRLFAALTTDWVATLRTNAPATRTLALRTSAKQTTAFAVRKMDYATQTNVATARLQPVQPMLLPPRV